MKRFCADPTALAFAAVGILLMGLAITWRINPVEGSVIPRFLTDNRAGQAVFWLLAVTCMPAMFLTLFLVRESWSTWVPHWLPFYNAALLLVQGVAYFLAGKLVAKSARKFSRKRAPPP